MKLKADTKNSPFCLTTIWNEFIAPFSTVTYSKVNSKSRISIWCPLCGSDAGQCLNWYPSILTPLYEFSSQLTSTKSSLICLITGGIGVIWLHLPCTTGIITEKKEKRIKKFCNILKTCFFPWCRSSELKKIVNLGATLKSNFKKRLIASSQCWCQILLYCCSKMFFCGQ